MSEGVILRALSVVRRPVLYSVQPAVSMTRTFTPANNNQHTTLTIAVKEANNDLRFAPMP